MGHILGHINIFNPCIISNHSSMFVWLQEGQLLSNLQHFDAEIDRIQREKNMSLLLRRNSVGTISALIAIRRCYFSNEAIDTESKICRLCYKNIGYSTCY